MISSIRIGKKNPELVMIENNFMILNEVEILDWLEKAFGNLKNDGYVCSAYLTKDALLHFREHDSENACIKNYYPLEKT